MIASITHQPAKCVKMTLTRRVYGGMAEFYGTCPKTYDPGSKLMIASITRPLPGVRLTSAAGISCTAHVHFRRSRTHHRRQNAGIWPKIRACSLPAYVPLMCTSGRRAPVMPRAAPTVNRTMHSQPDHFTVRLRQIQPRAMCWKMQNRAQNVHFFILRPS